MRTSRSSIEQRYRLLVLVILIAAVAVFMLAMRSPQSPIKVLGCTWDRVTQEATATTDPECRGEGGK